MMKKGVNDKGVFKNRRFICQSLDCLICIQGLEKENFWTKKNIIMHSSKA